ncbi:hypothetical protein [Serinibacter arcticus]|uniref:Exopolysaccharide biosynthesis domain protein n=1 Tax=Serinibacter arcticus TaxID=1655435 RepID=A0A4Z1DZ89_9MICO|nr:hypothetical protein [Serinibacter arcticus]TGO04239.1 Exopolysaccharide biosynthesis domain protein [Serinibacter arcticus]
MAWFRWRKNTPQVDEQQDVVQEQQGVRERDVTAPDDVSAVPAIDPEPEPDLPPEPSYEPEPVIDPEPTVEPDPEPFPEPDPVTDQLGSATTLQVAEQIVPSDQPAPVLAWNPGLRGVVVRIVHTAPSAAGSAEDLRAALENGLAAAVGEHSPAPHDADPEYPVVLNVTIAEETVDAEVTEVLASARKQLARKAVRVRLVVDQAPLAEIA